MVIDKYLSYINQGNFNLAAALFSDSGILAPPFEQQVVGRKAIYRYLERTIYGMYIESMPRKFKQFYNARTQVDIYGYYQTDSFTLNTNLTLLLNTSQEICLAQVKLMVPLKDLEKLRLYEENIYLLQHYTPSYTNGESYLKVVVNDSQGILAFI